MHRCFICQGFQIKIKQCFHNLECIPHFIDLSNLTDGITENVESLNCHRLQPVVYNRVAKSVADSEAIEDPEMSSRGGLET